MSHFFYSKTTTVTGLLKTARLLRLLRVLRKLEQYSEYGAGKFTNSIVKVLMLKIIRSGNDKSA